MNDFSESKFAWKGPFDKASVRLATSTRQTDLLLPGTPPPIELEIPISQLPLAGVLFGDEVVPIVQNGITCRTTVTSIAATVLPPLPVYSVNSTRIYTQSLIPTAVNTFPSLLYAPNGDMTVIYVNGRAYSDDSSPPSFTVSGHSVIWSDPSYSVYPTDNVVVTYAYNITMTGGGAVGVDAFAIDTRALTIATANVFPPLLFPPNGLMTIVYINGAAFSDDSIPPSFYVSDRTINWLSTTYSAVPGDEVVVTYAYNVGSSVTPVPPPSGGVITEALAVTSTNVLAPLTHYADGGSFILTIDGSSFVAVGASPPFSYAGHTITWLSTTYTIGTSANVAATYSYAAGA